MRTFFLVVLTIFMLPLALPLWLIYLIFCNRKTTNIIKTIKDGDKTTTIITKNSCY